MTTEPETTAINTAAKIAKPAKPNPFIARRSPFYAFEKPLNPSKPIQPRAQAQGSCQGAHNHSAQP